MRRRQLLAGIGCTLTLNTLSLAAHPDFKANLPPPLRVQFVSDAAALRAALAAAQAGDRIVLADGIYAGNFVLRASGTVRHPIVITAQNLLAAQITGDVALRGDYGLVHGLRFAGAEAGVTVFGAFARVTRCAFSGSTRYAVVELKAAGHSARIDHCSITVQPLTGAEKRGIARHGIVIECKKERCHFNAIIERNLFHDFPPKPDPEDFHSGYVGAVWVGTNIAGASNQANAIIAYNLFQNMPKEMTAALTVKACRTFVRFNTFLNGGSFVSLRQGWGNEVVGNWFENWNHLRIYDADHRLLGNKFVNAAGIWLATGTVEPRRAVKGWPYATHCLLAWNEGPIRVGVPWHPLPASHNIIEAHIGPIQYEHHIDTVVRDRSSVEPIQPLRLTPAEVGPTAP